MYQDISELLPPSYSNGVKVLIAGSSDKNRAKIHVAEHLVELKGIIPFLGLFSRSSSMVRVLSIKVCLGDFMAPSLL